MAILPSIPSQPHPPKHSPGDLREFDMRRVTGVLTKWSWIHVELLEYLSFWNLFSDACFQWSEIGWIDIENAGGMEFAGENRATKHDCHVLQNSCIRIVTYHMPYEYLSISGSSSKPRYGFRIPSPTWIPEVSAGFVHPRYHECII